MNKKNPQDEDFDPKTEEHPPRPDIVWEDEGGHILENGQKRPLKKPSSIPSSTSNQKSKPRDSKAEQG